MDAPTAIVYFVMFYFFINYMLIEMMVALIVEQSQAPMHLYPCNVHPPRHHARCPLPLALPIP